jgi:hypothetical protein
MPTLILPFSSVEVLEFEQDDTSKTKVMTLKNKTF